MSCPLHVSETKCGSSNRRMIGGVLTKLSSGRVILISSFGLHGCTPSHPAKSTQIARFVWPTWGPPGSWRAPRWPHWSCFQGSLVVVSSNGARIISALKRDIIYHDICRSVPISTGHNGPIKSCNQISPNKFQLLSPSLIKKYLYSKILNSHVADISSRKIAPIVLLFVW